MLIAACDTFRSGAVEQLRVHSRRLDTELFEMGYAKDAAHVRIRNPVACATGCMRFLYSHFMT